MASRMLGPRGHGIERQCFPVTLGMLAVFYLVGAVGILSRNSELFVRLTFASLVFAAIFVRVVAVLVIFFAFIGGMLP